MRIESICDKLLNRVHEKGVITGKVHSVFQKACNIHIDEGYLITVLNSRRFIYPMSAVISHREPMDFRELHITQGDAFCMDTQVMRFINCGITISMAYAKPWNSGLEMVKPCCSQERLASNIDKLELALSLYGKGAGIGSYITILGEYFPQLKIQLRLNGTDVKLKDYITIRLVKLIDEILKVNYEGIEEYAGSVIGFGAGLTPAADDFIGGIMISLAYIAEFYGLNSEAAIQFNKRLISRGAKSTTTISWEMLKHSADGNTGQCIKRLMGALFGEEGFEILSAAKDASTLGETSGTDIMLGIYTGLKIAVNIKNRGLWLNEGMYRNKEEYLL